MHRNEIIYALICINNHILSCLISMLSRGHGRGASRAAAGSAGDYNGACRARPRECAGVAVRARGVMASGLENSKILPKH